MPGAKVGNNEPPIAADHDLRQVREGFPIHGRSAPALVRHLVDVPDFTLHDELSAMHRQAVKIDRAGRTCNDVSDGSPRGSKGNAVRGRPEAAAAPATVSGKYSVTTPLRFRSR